MNANSQCSSCINWGEVGGGDWVPYGSTSARLPFEYGCAVDETGELDELALQFKCPKYEECPRCPEHPNQYILPDSGCAECEYETWREMDETAFQPKA